ncbi:hypothetical protein [Paenibacillus naphthalenovorans]|uniref:hypothetical protein n=1 Tax=Paenibacillus naphthalenovorans TaxID=162209 RepID=UPI001C31C2C0|nr:hypothetical protein [Paenibacillus naphthalenovorans]
MQDAGRYGYQQYGVIVMLSPDFLNYTALAVEIRGHDSQIQGADVLFHDLCSSW